MGRRPILRIALVDDSEIVHIGMRAALEPHSDLDLTWAGRTVRELLDSKVTLHLVLLNLRLGDHSSPRENVDRLQAAGHRVWGLTCGENPYLIRQAAEARVSGVLRKSEPADTLVEKLRLAATDRRVPGSDWTDALLTDPEAELVGLSPRQQEVLAMYADGADAVTVAKTLGIGVTTVPDYVARIRYRYAEAGRPAPSKTDLYKRAVEDGYLPIPRARA